MTHRRTNQHVTEDAPHAEERHEARRHRRHAHQETDAAPANDSAASDGATQAAQPATEKTSTERAEEMVDQIAAQIGDYAAKIGHGMLRWAARAREEAEDMLAEAETIRQRFRH